MFALLLLADVSVRHDAALHLATPAQMASLEACLVESWKKRGRVDVERGENRTDVAVSLPGAFHVLGGQKAIWVFHIEDRTDRRILSVGYNFEKSDGPGEKQLRKTADQCAPGAIELPAPPAPTQ